MIELSLDKRKKYKEDKKVLKEYEKRSKQWEKHRLFIERKKILAIEKVKTAQSVKAEKRLAKITKKKQKQLDIFVRDLKGLKPLKIKEDVKFWRKKAKDEICKYSKLLRADLNGYVKLMDTGAYVYWNKSQGGHLFGCKNFPHLQHEIDNIRPIKAWTNKMQLDQVGNRKDKVIEEIGYESFKKMETLSLDKGEKEKAKSLKMDYYQKIFEKYKKLNEKLIKDNPRLDPKNNLLQL